MKINFLKKKKKLGKSQEDETQRIMKEKIYKFYQRKSAWKKKKPKSFKKQKFKGSKIRKERCFLKTMNFINSMSLMGIILNFNSIKIYPKTTNR